MQRFVTATLLSMLLLLFAVPAFAQEGPITDSELQDLLETRERLLSQGTPEKEVQIVYSLNPWNGRSVGDGTIAVQHVDTMFAIANRPTLITARETEVYYWPITREYMADWYTMNEQIHGRLRIRQGNTVVDELEMQTYAHYFPEGSSSERETMLGEEAIQLYEDYNESMDRYYKEQNEYMEAMIEHSLQMDAILEQVRETGEYIAEDEAPKSPREPIQPRLFVFEPREAFALDLPPGRYEVEMIDDNGNVIPNTGKKLVVFSPRRTGLSYSVVPEHMWTRAFQTNDTAETLYLEGRRIFYLQPFEAEEYNQYQYLKSQILEQPLYGEGVKSSWAWIQTQNADTSYVLQILRDGEVVQEIRRKPYWVRQTSGHALGYNIVEFDEDDPAMYGREPSFYGYRIELEAQRGGYTMQMVDEDGNVVPGSVREIRSIRDTPPWALYGIPLIPFVIGMFVYARRRRLRPRSGKQPVEA